MPTSPETDGHTHLAEEQAMERSDAEQAAEHGRREAAAKQAVEQGRAEQAVDDGQAEQAVARDRDEEIAALLDQLARSNERQLRARADLDNYRKRTERDANRQLAAARMAVLLDWLPAVDSVERALRMEPGDAGLTAVLEQMRAILTRYGVVGIDAVGERFDPQRHEALVTRPDLEVPGHTVLEVLRSGFAVADGGVLRPAQVVVSQRPEGEF
jgi:molecular chaperone GrpE